ncbi:alpha/beta fold hydrolase [Tenacibaculum sp. UWU-22]|uniref:alpha/beta fold hydrolase n=1 Tax=Tenacibaculum sp. UWU-22 TaxID=3234187 RepID=UPI0034DAC01D
MQHTIDFKGAKVNFFVKGKGSAIVLLHGFLENQTMWKSISETLTKTHKVITIDLLGHGNTDCLGYIHTMELMADAVSAVLKHLRIRRFIVVGHSMGGYVALALAEKNIEKIKGFCLLNSTSYADDEERKKLRAKANKLIPKNFENMVRISFLNLFTQQSRKVYKETISRVLKEALKTPLQGYMACQEGMRERPSRNDVLKQLSCEKLLIIGKKDPVLNFETSLQEAIDANANSVVLSNGHMSHIEDENELILALQTFVKKC